MNVVTRDDLRYLIDRSGNVCVSIYLPTHRAGRERQQDPIRLKNLLSQAEEQLRSMKLSFIETQALLDPANTLLSTPGFWQQQGDGLAIFLSQGWHRIYRLPLRFEELLVISHSFHIKPLLPMLSGDGRFYILAVSKDRVRLLQGSRYSVNEIEPQGMPDSMAQALRFDDPERQLQFHTGTRPSAGAAERAAIYHGHGVGTNDHKTDILRYFYKVDDGLRNTLQDERVPLVLAGVDYLLPIYHEANSYQYLVDRGIEGNPDDLGAEDLHTKAWEIVQPIFHAEQEAAFARYRELAGRESGEANKNPEDIVRASYLGQVDTLFVATGIQCWGVFDPYNDEITKYGEFEPGTYDLLDFAAVHTLVNQGVVYAVDPEDIPDEGSVAAIFRYPLIS